MNGFDNTSLQYILLAQAVFVLGTIVAALAGAKLSHNVYSATLFIACTFLGVGATYGYFAPIVWQAPAPFYLGLAPLALRVDSLATLFLHALSVVGIATAIFSPQYLNHLKDRINVGFYWACLYVFMVGMSHVILSANAITFLVFWELMSLSSVALVVSEPTRHKAQRAAFIYLGATRISTAFLAAGFIWMHSVSPHSWDFGAWNLSTNAALLPACFILIGLTIKAGLWPFHIWLPYAHPEAPAPVSALMSGVMVKVAVYAMIRILIMGDCFSPVCAFPLLALGVISSAWGVLFALMQRDLKTLLAYSTVENIGLICCGLAGAIIARQNHMPAIANLALAASLMHVVNHCLFKSLLFLSAGCIDATAHSRNLSVLGGLAKGMKYTLICFFVGCVAICAMPPLNGFVSKWLFYKSFFQMAYEFDSLPERGIALVIVGVFAFVGAMSLAAFTKALGIGFLGRPRSNAAAKAKEAIDGMVFAQGFLVMLCVAAALGSPALFQWIEPMVSQGVDAKVTLDSIMTIPLVPLFLLSIFVPLLIYMAILRPKNSKLKEYITWDCGYGELPLRAEETGSSFSEPVGRIFSPLLQYRLDTVIKGRDRRHFPELIRVDARMLSHLETRVYRPVLEMLDWVSVFLARIQTGSIHIHLLYVFLTMVLVVCVGTLL